MEEPDPVKLVQLYLTSRSSLAQLVPKDRFAAYLADLDSSIDSEVLDHLYTLLQNQNDKRLKEANFVVKTTLGQVNPGDLSAVAGDASGAQIVRSLRDAADIDTIESTVLELERLNSGISQQRHQLQSQAEAKLREINELVDNLSDLKYGKLDLGTTIAESMDSLQRFQDKLLAQIEKKQV